MTDFTPNQHPLTAARAAKIWTAETGDDPPIPIIILALQAAYDAGFQEGRDALDPFRTLPNGTVLRDLETEDGNTATSAVIADGWVARGDWQRGGGKELTDLTMFTTDDRTRRYTRNTDGTWTYRDLTGA